MSQSIERDFEVLNDSGLHVRPAGRLVEAANRFVSQVSIEKDGIEVDGKSMLSLMLLAAEKGTLLRIRCRGPDAAEAMEAVGRLFLERFGEDV